MGMPDSDVGTHDNILRLIIERGPITSAELASILVLTPAAVRSPRPRTASDSEEPGPGRRGRAGRTGIGAGWYGGRCR